MHKILWNTFKTYSLHVRKPINKMINWFVLNVAKNVLFFSFSFLKAETKMEEADEKKIALVEKRLFNHAQNAERVI